MISDHKISKEFFFTKFVNVSPLSNFHKPTDAALPGDLATAAPVSSVAIAVYTLRPATTISFAPIVRFKLFFFIAWRGGGDGLDCC